MGQFCCCCCFVPQVTLLIMLTNDDALQSPFHCYYRRYYFHSRHRFSSCCWQRREVTLTYHRRFGRCHRCSGRCRSGRVNIIFCTLGLRQSPRRRSYSRRQQDPKSCIHLDDPSFIIHSYYYSISGWRRIQM